jgi:hypothetical protein
MQGRGTLRSERRLVEVVDAVGVVVYGKPNPGRNCTSHRTQNLSIHKGMHRMTRLTNGFSKKWEDLQAAYSLWSPITAAKHFVDFWSECRVGYLSPPYRPLMNTEVRTGFYHRENSPTSYDSICLKCFRTVSSQRTEDELGKDEENHTCDPVTLRSLETVNKATN